MGLGFGSVGLVLRQSEHDGDTVSLCSKYQCPGFLGMTVFIQENIVPKAAILLFALIKDSLVSLLQSLRGRENIQLHVLCVKSKLLSG